MAVKIRMTRMGRRHRPFFRINAIDSRTPRDGRILEKLGHYDPLEKDADKQVVLNKERIEYWLAQGAVTSETVGNLLAKHGMVTKHYEERLARRKRALAIARKADKPFDETERKQAQKATDSVIEGIATCKSVCALADKYNVEMPIVRAVYQVLFENKPVRQAIAELMQRQLKAELE